MKEEYVSRFIDGNIGKATWDEARKNQSILNDHIPEDQGPLAPEVTSRLPPLDCTPEEADLIGYMSYRDDYVRVRFLFIIKIQIGKKYTLAKKYSYGKKNTFANKLSYFLFYIFFLLYIFFLTGM